MDLPNELWYNVFSFLTQRSMSKFSCLWNLHNLSTKEIEFIHCSNDLWFDTAKKGYIKLKKFLIQNGANLNIQNNYSSTSLQIASIYGHKEYAELLIKAGADLNSQDNIGWTALHNASRNDYKEIVELLIKAGADLNIQNKYGWTAMHLASKFGHEEIIKLLIANGADVSIQNNDGHTVLQQILSNYSCKDIVELLINAGANKSSF